MDEDGMEDLIHWGDLPKDERRALRRAAQSQLWWEQLGKRVKGLGPVVTAVLSCLALWQLMGEGLKEWLTK